MYLWRIHPKILEFQVVFFGLMFPALGANVLAFKSLGWSPASFFLYRRDIGVPPMNNISNESLYFSSFDDISKISKNIIYRNV